jgi:hypothetical protein
VLDLRYKSNPLLVLELTLHLSVFNPSLISTVKSFFLGFFCCRFNVFALLNHSHIWRCVNHNYVLAVQSMLTYPI